MVGSPRGRPNSGSTISASSTRVSGISSLLRHHEHYSCHSLFRVRLLSVTIAQLSVLCAKCAKYILHTIHSIFILCYGTCATRMFHNTKYSFCAAKPREEGPRLWESGTLLNRVSGKSTWGRLISMRLSDLWLTKI